MPELNKDQFQTFYHGTSAPGLSEVTPGEHARTTYGTQSKAYATSDENQAWNYAETSWKANNPDIVQDVSGDAARAVLPVGEGKRVYEVSPKGDFRPDQHHETPSHTSDRPPSYKPKLFESEEGWDVGRELWGPEGSQGRLFGVGKTGKLYDYNTDLSRREDVLARDESSRLDAGMMSRMEEVAATMAATPQDYEGTPELFDGASYAVNPAFGHDRRQAGLRRTDELRALGVAPQTWE